MVPDPAAPLALPFSEVPTMHPRSRVLFLCLFAACSDAHAGSGSPTMPPATASAVVPSISDAPLAAYKSELLDVAFKAASAFPVKPHLKNRSRAQETVVEASLALDQPRRALAYAEQIDNWLRGVAYAEFALYCARHGSASEVEHYLDLARQVSNHQDDESAQDWQRDRIRVTIARTYAQLGQRERAAESQEGVVDSEAGKVEAATLDEQLRALDAAVATGNFDQVRNDLQVCAQFFDRVYADASSRSRVEEKIKGSWAKMPPQVRIELLMTMTGFALGHEDREEALALVNEARDLLDDAQWNPEDLVPLSARLAGLRYRAGDTEKARREADRAVAVFDTERDKIVDIFRAAALRPVAETYEAMGDAPAALAVYKRAVEAGVENPNSRPRADDLTATCCSMALHDVEPDPALKTRISSSAPLRRRPWPAARAAAAAARTRSRCTARASASPRGLGSRSPEPTSRSSPTKRPPGRAART